MTYNVNALRALSGSNPAADQLKRVIWDCYCWQSGRQTITNMSGKEEEQAFTFLSSLLLQFEQCRLFWHQYSWLSNTGDKKIGNKKKQNGCLGRKPRGRWDKVRCNNYSEKVAPTMVAQCTCSMTAEGVLQSVWIEFERCMCEEKLTADFLVPAHLLTCPLWCHSGFLFVIVSLFSLLLWKFWLGFTSGNGMVL